MSFVSKACFLNDTTQYAFNTPSFCNPGFGAFDFSDPMAFNNALKTRFASPTQKTNSNFRPYDYTKYGMNGDKIRELDPKMQEKTMMLLDYAKAQGMKVTINSGYRTKEKQAQLLKTNRFAAKKSLHCEGKAIDIRIASGKDADYKKLGDYAKSIGMRWGGDLGYSLYQEFWGKPKP